MKESKELFREYARDQTYDEKIEMKSIKQGIEDGISLVKGRDEKDAKRD